MNKKRILLFTADWCAPCKAVKSWCDERVEIIDVEEDTERVERFTIKSLPTVIVLIDDEVVDKHCGNFKDKKAFEDFINGE